MEGIVTHHCGTSKEVIENGDSHNEPKEIDFSELIESGAYGEPFKEDEVMCKNTGNVTRNVSDEDGIVKENRSNTQVKHGTFSPQDQERRDGVPLVDLYSLTSQSESEPIPEQGRKYSQMEGIVTHHCGTSKEVIENGDSRNVPKKIDFSELIESGAYGEPFKEDEAMCKNTGNVTRNVSDEDGIVKENRSNTQVKHGTFSPRDQERRDGVPLVNLCSLTSQSESEPIPEQGRKYSQMEGIITHHCGTSKEVIENGDSRNEPKKIDFSELIESGAYGEPFKEDEAMCKNTGNVTRNVSDEDGIVKENRSNTQVKHGTFSPRDQERRDGIPLVDLCSLTSQSESEPIPEQGRKYSQMEGIITHHCGTSKEVIENGDSRNEPKKIDFSELIESGAYGEPFKEDEAMCKNTGNVTRNVSDEDGIVKENRSNTQVKHGTFSPRDQERRDGVPLVDLCSLTSQSESEPIPEQGRKYSQMEGIITHHCGTSKEVIENGDSRNVPKKIDFSELIESGAYGEPFKEDEAMCKNTGNVTRNVSDEDGIVKENRSNTQVKPGTFSP